MGTTGTAADPGELRAALVAGLIASGHLRTPEIIAAFEETERHLFAPGSGLETAYRDDTVPVKHGSDGTMISCLSTPSIIALQLEQLGVRPGDRVLEAGAASGFNAALLARLTGPAGRVLTLDVDQDLVDGATRNLAAAGVRNVTVMLGDGAAGLPRHAPFDRVQFTVGAGDIPVKVLDQVAEGGRLVIPMRVRGSISRSFAFEREPGAATWRTSSSEMATFVPLRNGIGDDARTIVPVDGDGNVTLETYSEQDADAGALRTVLDQPPHRVRTGVRLGPRQSVEWLYLWLAGILPNGLSRMPGQRPGYEPMFKWGSMAAVDGGTLAYLTWREEEDETGRWWEFGVTGHGPRAASLAGDVAGAIAEWGRRGGNDAPAPWFRLAVAADRGLLAPGDHRFIIDKPASRLAVCWG